MAESPSQKSPTPESSTQESPIEIAKPIIAQCRREIAAGLAQVEAARAELKRTRALHERWAEQVSEELSHDRPRSEGFVMVPAPKRSRNRRRSAS
jgi:hypothetical protein